ncbi:hypothetical protein Lepto7376_0302 [[Leptolyngbya] sp. PCC 7376]|uniref:hypothetical protein n=1 Tax=[Leptolyngbya] sp. PCC 7376 TaxID=111781 RepID=UPI00029EEEF4|nr:hypothetical protein [[Leptolyngbya] sp. PCC 7376]AFY36744.1 hypothetical protein Lepto7376_0302 [[Leptolyngbya] sp. PCC 7376]
MASQTTINITTHDQVNAPEMPKLLEESLCLVDFDEADIQALEALLDELIIGDVDFRALA